VSVSEADRVKVLIVGTGGREHALAWKLLQSPQVTQITCVPGNGGTATLERCKNLGMAMDDFEGIGRFCKVNNFNIVIIGPEVPLSLGITDYLQALQIPVFGPTQAGAQIESSKAWAKELMAAAGIPTARSQAFTELAAALNYVQQQGAPIVIKADGLAAGKGVTVAQTVAEAEAALTACFDGAFGAAGQSVLVEECLVGQELSVLAITDGTTIRPLLPAQDHKRIGVGDTGENTGGMGVYAPAPIGTPALMDRIQQEILEPAIAALKARNIDYRGILYAGLMITPAGDPVVIEFNCRFGDPETQAILPLLATPLDKLMLACIHGKLADFPPLEWHTGTAACVVVAAEGYPGPYKKGQPIDGIGGAQGQGALVFHAGTRLKSHALISDGGRVLGVTSVGDNFDEAFERVYRALNQISFEGMYYRSDIGHQVRSPAAGR
jgi:phosphoribosylamine---glycine ligase